MWFINVYVFLGAVGDCCGLMNNVVLFQKAWGVTMICVIHDVLIVWEWCEDGACCWFIHFGRQARGMGKLSVVLIWLCSWMLLLVLWNGVRQHEARVILLRFITMWLSVIDVMFEDVVSVVNFEFVGRHAACASLVVNDIVEWYEACTSFLNYEMRIVW